MAVVLTNEQHQHLLELIKNREVNWKISNYLTLECGLSFTEASALRHKIIEDEEQKRRLVDIKSKEDRREAPPPPPDSEEASMEVRFEDIPSPLPDRPPISSNEPDNIRIERGCIKCHDETYSCSCPIKYLKDLPV